MKILILRLSSIGDIVLTQPVPRVLKEIYPDSRIDFLTKQAYKGIVEAFGCIDNVYLWKDKRTVINIIRRNRYDLIIDLHSKLNTFIIKSFSGARKIITVKKRHWYRWALTKKIVKNPNLPMCDIYLQTLTKLNIEPKNYVPELHPDQLLKENIIDLFKREKIDDTRKLVGIFPGALHYTKCYPADQLAQFINRIPDKQNCNILILGSGADMTSAEEIIRLTESKVYNLCGKLNIPELIVLIDRLNVIISNDSGPMHIAAALQKPQIAIFGGTHSVLGFSPLNFNARVLQANLTCQPCSAYGLEKCPLGTLECMKKITPEHLLEAFEELAEDQE
jgi:lipopolysaccharide heptosyltransferase II